MPARDASGTGWRETTPHPGHAPLIPDVPVPSTTLERVLIVFLALTGTALMMRFLLGA